MAKTVDGDGDEVRTYSEWVIDGDYDWPPACCKCQAVLEESTNSDATRLDVIHSQCLASHVQSLPSYTAPSGYACPGCSAPIWPPKSVKDSGSQLHAKLKDVTFHILVAPVGLYIMFWFEYDGLDDSIGFFCGVN